MKEKHQKLLYDAIDSNRLDLYREAIEQGADLYTPVLETKYINEFRKFEPAAKSAVHMAVYCADRYELTTILDKMQEDGVLMEDAIRDVLGNAKDVITTAPTQIFSFIKNNHPSLYGAFSEAFSIHDIVEFGDSKKLDILIKDGADVNAVDKKGRSTLMLAQNAMTFNMLIEHGADMSATCLNGKTVLWHAVQTLYKEDRLFGGRINNNLTSNGAMPNVVKCANNLGLVNDHDAIDLSKKIRELLDAGLYLDGKPAIENESFKTVIAQVNMIEAEQKKINLGGYLNKEKSGNHMKKPVCKL